MIFKHPLDALKYHVSGAIERGEGEAIVGIPHMKQYIFVHVHKYGVDTYQVNCNVNIYVYLADDFESEKLIAACAKIGINFEPDRGETLNINSVSSSDPMELFL